jgi:hypothetical protein
MLGASETTRRTGMGMRTMRPVSSETVRKLPFSTDDSAFCAELAWTKFGEVQSSAASSALRKNQLGRNSSN